MTPLKAIRLKCIDCMCGQIYEVAKCPCDDCSLYQYRMGHNPSRKGHGGSFSKTKSADSIASEEGNTASEGESE